MISSLGTEVLHAGIFKGESMGPGVKLRGKERQTGS